MYFDLKYALRQLGKRPGFTVTVLATFALCIGANALIFSVVHAVLLKPLPFRNPEQLVITRNSYPKAGIEHIGSSAPNYIERKQGVPAFAEVAALRGGSAIVGESGNPERVPALNVTPSFFRVLGVAAARGRLFREEEGIPGRGDVLVLSDAFWRQNCNADPAAVGRTLKIDGAEYTVVGVLPANFSYLGVNVRIWKPLTFLPSDLALSERHDNSLSVIARLKPGFSLAEAQAEIDALNHRAQKEDPQNKLASDSGFRTDVYGLRADFVAGIRPALLALQSGVIFLLLIAVVNLVNLFLIRANAQARDQAVRQVLGASLRRLAAQAISETMLLSLAGGVLGLGVAAAGLKLLTTLGAQRLPLGTTISLDAPVAAAAVAGSAIMGLCLALPVVAASFKHDLAPALSAESRSGTASGRTHRLRHSLIVAQVALAFVLLSGAGLLGLSFKHILATAPGFRPENVITGEILLTTKNYQDYAKRFSLDERLLEAMNALPGTTKAALSTMLPAVGGADNRITWVEGRTPPTGSSLRSHYIYRVAGNYFAAAGLTLRAGRFLTPADSQRANRVCVVDDDLARHYWPGESALDHRISFDPPGTPSPTMITIVGVVGAVKQTDLTDERGTGAIYLPFYADKSDESSSPMVFFTIMRTLQAPEAAVSGLRRAVAQADPGLPLGHVETMQGRIDDTLTTRRSTLLLAGIFAAMALLLAAVGVYGVLSYAVNQRQREIGVRMALGAIPAQILAKFLWLGCRLLLLGASIGLVGAWCVGRAMGSLLFGVSTFNPAVIAGTAAVLGVVVLLASFLPSRRAAKVDPMIAMRAE